MYGVLFYVPCSEIREEELCNLQNRERSYHSDMLCGRVYVLGFQTILLEGGGGGRGWGDNVLYCLPPLKAQLVTSEAGSRIIAVVQGNH